MEAVVEQTGGTPSAVMPDLISKMRGATTRIFGCWHVNMSRPFSRGSETYRTCVACGARRRFDLDQCQMVGSFYYPEGNVGLYARSR